VIEHQDFTVIGRDVPNVHS